LKSKPFDEWRQLWIGNPCYQEVGPDWPIGWVLENQDGRVVGSLGNLPLPYVFQGRKLLVATGRGWAVEEEYRGFALLLMDEYFNQPDVDLFLNTTVNASAETAFSTFGSLRVPAGDWSVAAFIVTGYLGFTESAFRIKRVPLPLLLSFPAGAALYARDRLRSKRIHSSDIEVKLESGFDERFETFWRSLSESNPVLLAVRSREMLRWHFAGALDRSDLSIFTVSRPDGEIRAYGIFERRDEPRYRLKRARLVDFQALDFERDYQVAILQRALAEFRSQGVHIVEHVGCELAATRAFDQWALHRRQLPAWCYYYQTSDAAFAGQLTQPFHWAPSTYDGDSSL
jgi:hypothetical protein